MDNKKGVKFSGVGIYLFIVIIAAMFIMYVSRMNSGTSDYTYSEFVRIQKYQQVFCQLK